MNEYAKVLLSCKVAPLRLRMLFKIRHWIWKFKTRNKPDAF